MKPLIYFGHPIPYYGTADESGLISIIQESFPKFDVENPGTEAHAEVIRRYIAEGRKPMEYFFGEVLPRMSAGVFLPFSDGMYGAGVYGEAEFLRDRKKPIYEISLSGVITPIFKLDERRKLSIPDTKERVKNGQK